MNIETCLLWNRHRYLRRFIISGSRLGSAPTRARKACVPIRAGPFSLLMKAKTLGAGARGATSGAATWIASSRAPLPSPIGSKRLAAPIAKNTTKMLCVSAGYSHRLVIIFTSS